jgi:hypothetical protein
MKNKIFVAAILSIVIAVLVASPAPPNANAGTDQKSKKDTFSAMAYLPAGAGVRMVGAGATANLTIHIESYTTDDEAQQ